MAAVVTMPRRKALTQVKRGVLQTPVRVLIYGAEKVGKSSWAAGSPNPIFIGAESGTERLDVARLQPSSWAEAVAWIGDLATDEHDYKTLVIDPVNWLEPMCWDAVCTAEGKGNTIEEYGGGFMKGYLAALTYWRVLLAQTERCWLRGMNVIMTAHMQVKTFKNPEGPGYDRYELAMHEKAAGLLKQWVDAVLFARLETFAKVAEKGKRAQGFMTGARLLHTQPSAAYDAGTRWKLPEVLPLSWDDFYSAVQGEDFRADELLENIASMTKELGDPALTSSIAKFLETNKKNADRLAELANRLSLKLDTKRQETP